MTRPPSILSELSRSGQEGYQSAINSAVRGLWRGVLTRANFRQAMLDTIGRWLTIAWREGMTDAGMNPDDMSEEEQLALGRMIADESQYIGGFGDDIEAGSKANGGALQPLLGRAAKWASKYSEAKGLARVMASADQKLEWVYDPKKEHCPDCAKLNGRVKRASEWVRKNIIPKSRMLACFGIYCGCKLRPTNKPISKGPLPRLSRA